LKKRSIAIWSKDVRRRGRGEGFHLDIAPINLIDLLLILLIFFITTTTFLQLKVIDLNLPNAAAAKDPKKKPHAYTIAIDANCSYYLDKNATTLRALEETVNAASPDTLYRIGADEESKHRCFIALLDLLTQKGVDKISILTEER